MSLTKKTSLELLSLTRSFIPPLLPQFHKGQLGRILVIGGCEDYTGAPFFSAHASLLMGCDLTHVICEKLALPVIKGYSPDLMVHPYLFERANLPASDTPVEQFEDQFLEQQIMPKVESLLGRIHVVVVGPGFGRDPLMLKSLKRIIAFVKTKQLPIILDLDALFLLSQDANLIKGYERLILTPNVVEFQRLCKLVGLEASSDQLLIELSKRLGNVTVLQKGANDFIVNGDNFIRVESVTGSSKRVGGQGDSMSGCIATLLLWGFASYKPGLWPELKLASPKLTDQELILLSCYSGGFILRKSAQKLFAKYHRSMQTSNLHEFIGDSYDEVFG